jgi:hypothetical protein
VGKVKKKAPNVSIKLFMGDIVFGAMQFAHTFIAQPLKPLIHTLRAHILVSAAQKGCTAP